MQFSLRMSTLLACLVVPLSLQAVQSLSLSIAHPKSQFHTLSLRHAEQPSDVHPHILFQMQINRGIRRLAKMTGAKPPSSESLRQLLEKRILSIDVSTSIHERTDGPRDVGEVELEGHSNLVRVSKRQDRVKFAKPPTATHSLGLDIDGPDTGFLASLWIGTPPREFLITMDSGSSDFWVGSETCTTKGQESSGCGNHNFLGPGSSSSFTPTDKPFSIQYGEGSVSGFLVRDNVKIAGLSLKNFTFAVADVETTDFSRDSNPDGLMGLAGPALSKNPTPVEALFSAKLIPAPIVSYKLPRLANNINDGEITFGGLDDSKFDSKTLINFPSTNPGGFWQTNLDGISVNGQSLPKLKNRKTILDTGTTLLLMPPADANVIHSKIPEAQPDGQGGFLIPCNTTASVVLTYHGRSFSIDPRDLVSQYTGRAGLCFSGIGSMPHGLKGHPNTWIVGATFLKNVYFSTNLADNSISLAKLV